MKKMVWIFILCLTATLFAGCNESDLEDAADMVQDVVQQTNPYVQSVKNATPNEYPGITYGEAFEEFFGSPTWKHFTAYRDESDNPEEMDSEEMSYEEEVSSDVSSSEENSEEADTIEVVEFTGKCMYDNQEVKAVMQYTISDDEKSFELTYFAFNKIAQNLFVYSALFDNAFESYQEKHMNEIESEMENSSSSEEEISEEEMEAQEEIETESDMESETEETESSGGMWEGIYTQVGSGYTYDIWKIGKNKICYTVYHTDMGSGYILKDCEAEIQSESTASDGVIHFEWIDRENMRIEGDFNYGFDELGSVEGDYYLNDTLPEDDVDWIEYIIPHSSEAKVTKSDLKGLTAKELTYARNEIYARHGYVFSSKELNKYFRSTDWYVPIKSYDGTLSSIEQRNVTFISNYQNKNGLTYKPK